MQLSGESMLQAEKGIRYKGPNTEVCLQCSWTIRRPMRLKQSKGRGEKEMRMGRKGRGWQGDHAGNSKGSNFILSDRASSESDM